MGIQTVSNVIDNKVKYESLLSGYTSELIRRANPLMLDELCRLRAFNLETLKESSIFYIGDMAEMILPKYFDNIGEFGVISETNHKPIFRNRWVMPIKSPNGEVQNFVGYSPYADERYIYGTSKYYRRRDTLYGLENLEMAYDLGYAFVTEGITDTIRLRDLGYKNSFAMCGTHKSEYIRRQLNRCRHGVILIPDRDDAGLGALKGWQFNRSVTIFINFQYKDIDEMCVIKKDDGSRVKNEENIEWFKSYADASIEWLKSDTHNGKQSHCEKITVL